MGNESPNAHDSKFMIGFVPSAQHPTLLNYVISQQCCDCENESWNMRVKNTVAIVKTTVLPVIHKTYILKEKFEPNQMSQLRGAMV